MNFLGHAYIARNHPNLIAGNFAGDSYKGKLDNFDLPKNIIQGIKLHRFIDDYTDHSETILTAGHIFHAEGIKKIAYIATDLLLDHYLAREWVNFSSKDYAEFIDEVYKNTERFLPQLMPDFQGLYANLKEYEWFFDYPSEDGMRLILKQFSHRIRFENELPRCMDIYLAQQSTFDELFSNFLIDISERSVEFIDEL